MSREGPGEHSCQGGLRVVDYVVKGWEAKVSTHTQPASLVCYMHLRSCLLLLDPKVLTDEQITGMLSLLYDSGASLKQASREGAHLLMRVAGLSLPHATHFVARRCPGAVHDADANGMTAVHHALLGASPDATPADAVARAIVEILATHGADVRVRGSAPLVLLMARRSMAHNHVICVQHRRPRLTRSIRLQFWPHRYVYLSACQ